MASLKANVLLNAVNTLTGILFPVITFPYAARVLLPEGIGAINFLNSIIGYIVLLTSLGIPMYAVKEVAKYRDQKDELNRITIEILILSFILCILGYVVVLLLAEYVPQIHRQASLFYILSLTIIFTTIGVNWFYQGIEDFKFITIRAIIIRTLAAVALFIFVKDSSDLLTYGGIVVGSTVGNNFINFIHLRKHVSIQSITFKNLRIARHIKPSLQIFILNLITSLYVHLNAIMLGFMAGDSEVGYFTAGTKITYIGITIITSLGTVLLPRCSHLLQIGDTTGFAHVISKSLNITLMLALPLTAGLMVLAVPVIMIFCGNEFIPAIPVLYITAPIIIFICLTNVLGIQILYPMDKVKLVIISVTGGAITNLVLNLLLIPSFQAIGAAVSTVIAEAIVLVIQLVSGRIYYPFRLRAIFTPKYILATLLMSVVVYLCCVPFDSMAIRLIIGISAGVVTYLSFLLLSKDKLTLEFVGTIKNKLIKPKNI